MAKRRRYDDQFRASAVVMLEAAGYPTQKGALSSVAAHLSVPVMTLRGWYTAEHNPPPTELRNEKKEELADLFEDVARKYIAHAAKSDVIEGVAGNTAVIAAATAVDKMRLLRGLPTEIVQLIPDVIAALRMLNQEPSDVFNAIIQRARQKQEQGG